MNAISKDEKYWLSQHAAVLSELRQLSDRQIKLLDRKTPELLEALFDMRAAFEHFEATVHAKTVEESRKLQAKEDSMMLVAGILTENPHAPGTFEFIWHKFPEAKSVVVDRGRVWFVAEAATDGLQIVIRCLPDASVDEIISVPRDSSWLDDVAEWRTPGSVVTWPAFEAENMVADPLPEPLGGLPQTDEHGDWAAKP